MYELWLGVATLISILSAVFMLGVVVVLLFTKEQDERKFLSRAALIFLSILALSLAWPLAFVGAIVYGILSAFREAEIGEMVEAVRDRVRNP